MPNPSLISSYGNPILVGFVISIVMFVLIGYAIYTKKWEMFIFCFLAWMILFIKVVFPNEMADIASKLADHHLWIDKE
ncbi:hypothetical protein RW25_11675 [Bacillus sp. L_1B0_8]|uniref:hypothetical protein n=1 Tax=unclassified Bacillus (in: firmicutes) TaxID=185979 RepID=UPI0005B72BF0|nr:MULTISPECIES: hypothetical protein [unclassified Bacillus (in: firmicutes)]KIQ77085.1 hypothetical protein RT27_31485 [Bacillus sp. L_1B0_5]KIQ89357.1 hypothetical protein RW25_11675 [Bacillus sp. L_1B0_8]